MVKNPSAMWETWVRSLRWEDPLEKGKATHSSIRPGEFCIMENSREFMACIVHAVAKSWPQLSDFHITSYCFPYCLPHFRSHQQMYEGSLHTLSNIYLQIFLYDGLMVIPHCDFDLHFSNNQQFEHLFMCLLAISMYSLKKCLYRLDSFSVGLFCCC